MDGKISHSRY